MPRTVVVAVLLLVLHSSDAIHADEDTKRDREAKRTEAALLAALDDENYQVRRKAVLAVEGREEPALFERVLRMAQSDPHPNIRGYTADVLSTFRDARVFDVLAVMAKESSPGPQQSAFVGLGRYGDPRAFVILIKGLDAGRGRRGYAAKGLGLLGDARAFKPVEAAYRAHPEDPYLNEMAPAALVALDQTRGLALCRECFLTLPSVARSALARELGRHPSAETRELMLTQLREAGDAGLRDAAIQVLAQLADPKSADGLLDAFRDHPESRAGVASALGRLGERRAVAPLLDALAEESEGHVKNIYVEALGRIGDPRSVSALIELLDAPGFVAQPERFSAVLGFPWNVWTRGAALWAIRTILDGSPPFKLVSLVTFPRRAPDQAVVTGIHRLKAWWAAHEKDEAYRPTSD